MTPVIITADICSIVVLFAILTTYIGTGTSLSRRDFYFFVTCATMLLGCIADSLSYLLLTAAASGPFFIFLTSMEAFCYSSEYLTSLFFICYLFEIADMYHHGYLLLRRLFISYTGASFLTIFSMILYGRINGNSSVFDATMMLQLLAEGILLILYIIILLLIKPCISFKYWLAAASTPFGLFVMIPIILFLPELDIGFAIGCVTLLFIHLSIQTDESTRYYKTIDSLAHIYKSIHLINLSDDKLVEISADERIHNLDFEHAGDSIQTKLWHIMDVVVCQAHRGLIRDFTDMSTVEERLAGESSIHVEAINDEGKWWSFGLIRIGDVDSPLQEVLFTCEYIDDAKRKEETLLWMSHTDRLTGLYNYHAYEEDIQKYSGTGLGDDTWYLLLDMNGLKKINDEMGHHAGNEVISAIGTILALSVSEGGHVYRLGGDEFAVLIRTDADTIDDILSSIRLRTEGWNSKHLPQISYSIGVVSSGEFPAQTVKELAMEADRRMYERKQAYYQQT